MEIRGEDEMSAEGSKQYTKMSDGGAATARLTMRDANMTAEEPETRS
jgi:hypothetical protein